MPKCLQYISDQALSKVGGHSFCSLSQLLIWETTKAYLGQNEPLGQYILFFSRIPI